MYGETRRECHSTPLRTPLYTVFVYTKDLVFHLPPGLTKKIKFKLGIINDLVENSESGVGRTCVRFKKLEFSASGKH